VTAEQNGQKRIFLESLEFDDGGKNMLLTLGKASIVIGESEGVSCMKCESLI
jgi:hypothetical protein